MKDSELKELSLDDLAAIYGTRARMRANGGCLLLFLALVWVFVAWLYWGEARYWGFPLACLGWGVWDLRVANRCGHNLVRDMIRRRELLGEDSEGEEG